MKAMVKKSLAGDAPLVPVEMPTREPRAWEIRVAVKASSVNPADWKMLSSVPATIARRMLTRSGTISAGIDFAGIVDAVGSRVTKIKPGDAVAGVTLSFLGGQGGYADTVIVPARMACPLPDGFDLVTAGALPVAGYTAWKAVVEIGRVKKGQKALILGASGGVGHLAVQIAKHVCGAFTVGVCSGKNEKLVKDLGADVVVDYKKGDPLEQAKAHGPYQVVVDCVGDYSGAKCRALLAPSGKHVNVSPASANGIAQLIASPLKSRTLQGVPIGAQLRPVTQAIAADRIKVIVSERIPLADINKAFALSQTGRTVGKIAIVP
ncbi:MAG: NAD(P)-dependent alcohol dehydrogenase [Bdellovibrionota bacterium]